MHKNVKVVKELIRLRFQNMMVFRLAFFGPFFVDGSLFIVQLLVFKAVYSNVDKIGTWGSGEMMIFIGSFSLVNAINMIVYFFGVIGIPWKIKNGEMDLYLTKPVSPLLRLTFENINPGSLPLLLLSVAIISYGVALSHIELTVIIILKYAVGIFLMTILWYEMEVIIRALTFFIGSTSSIGRIEEAGIDLCMKVPGIALKGIYKIIFYFILPYGIMATFPTLSLVGEDSMGTWLWSVGSVILFGVFMAIIWKLGIRKYNSVSS